MFAGRGSPMDDIEHRHRCNVDALGDLGARFVELDVDEGARRAVRQTAAARHGRLRSLMHRALRPVMSDFDINGLLRTHRMHLLTTRQWQQLIGEHRHESLLDVGAGSGDVTAALAPLFGQVVTTETSRMMVRRLRERGFPCQRIDIVTQPPEGGPFDVVTCLNVIDRCASPRSLIERARDSMVAGGCLELAVVLPYEPFFYDGGRTLDPVEHLDLDAPTWEGGAQQLTMALGALGLEVESLCRAPYLSSGGPGRALWANDNVIVVARRSPVPRR
jgi:SAM-dependent methyltransferase